MKSILYKAGGIFSLLFILSIAFVSCDFEYDLPEAGSIADETPPMAGFSFAQTDQEDFRVVSFTNESVSATEYAWNFGGDTSTEEHPSYTFADEGTYTITLSVKDGNGVTDEVTRDITVIKPEEPDAIDPEVLNGDFDGGQDDWKFSSFTGGTTSPFNSSSDGSPLNYDGSDSGSTKTAGAKWTMGTSAGVYLSSSTRYAYQALTVSPNVEYWFEYEYSIKNDGTQAEGGNRIIGGIIDGHYSDGADAIPAFDASPLFMHVGSEDLGKGTFTNVRMSFTANETGQIAILIYGVTDVDAYVDNVKVYPKE